MHSQPVLDVGYGGGRAGARIEMIPGRARGEIDAWARMRSGPMLSVLPAWKPWKMKHLELRSDATMVYRGDKAPNHIQGKLGNNL
jgi:hypothetical protein